MGGIRATLPKLGLAGAYMPLYELPTIRPLLVIHATSAARALCGQLDARGITPRVVRGASLGVPEILINEVVTGLGSGSQRATAATAGQTVVPFRKQYLGRLYF